MIRFVWEFERFLFDHHICVTEGLWNAISGYNLLADHQNIKRLRSKRDGGILEATAMVVDGYLDVVIFLIDPTDMASLFPDCAALKRECVANNKFFLSTYASACEWATLVWFAPGQWVLTEKESKDLQQSRHINVAADLSNQTIALIAHDKMKISMIQFASRHKGLLEKFGNIIGTGTTARLLKGEKKVGELDGILKDRSPEESKDLEKAINEVRLSKLSLPIIQEKRSGPKGGDIQIARMVMDGKCNKVIFFEDPFTARPHEPDIQLLERTCQIYGESVTCFSDPISADLWAEAWKLQEGDYRDSTPATLARALEKYLSSIATHAVHVILSSTDDDEKETIRNVCGIAAHYLDTLIVKMGIDKDREELRLVVPWGTIMGDLIEELEKIRTLQKNPWKVPNLVALPMTGSMHSVNPSVEATSLAEKITGLFGGKHYSIPVSALVSGSAVLGLQVEEVLRQFEKADIVLLHGKPILYQDHFGTVNRAPVDPKIIRHVSKRGAICEISGLFLNNEGMEITHDKYQRVGMNYQRLKNAGNNAGCRSILLIGTPNERIEDYMSMTEAIFRAGFPSVLITDVTFARYLLGLGE